MSASPENQEEVVLHCMTWLQKSNNVTPAGIKRPPRAKRREHRHHYSAEGVSVIQQNVIWNGEHRSQFWKTRSVTWRVWTGDRCRTAVKSHFPSGAVYHLPVHRGLGFLSHLWAENAKAAPRGPTQATGRGQSRTSRQICIQ